MLRLQSKKACSRMPPAAHQRSGPLSIGGYWSVQVDDGELRRPVRRRGDPRAEDISWAKRLLREWSLGEVESGSRLSAS